jgi:DNA-binding transcriptional ArsR family regulator
MDEISRARAVAALRFRALGDETRLRILEFLVEGECSVAELIDSTGLGQSLVSHHLRTLRDAGLVVTRRDGRWIFYDIADVAMTSVRQVLTRLQPGA